MSDLPNALGEQALRIYLLGGFKVSRGAKTIEAGAWKLRKAKSLLKLLALAPGHRLHREQVMELLWPDLEPEYAANNLHQALFAARRALASIGGVDASNPLEIIRMDENVLLLDPPGELWIDAEAFQQAAAQARRSQEPAAYRAALDLYTGELLPEDRYEDWATTRRDALEGEYIALLLDFARLYAERGEIPAANTLYQQVLAKDPSHEEAIRGLMRLYVRAGQRREALRLYTALEERLHRELDTTPTPESAHLYEEIRTGRFALPEIHIPASAAPPARLHNLPSPLSTFVGREKEIIQVYRLVEHARLVTLTGPGGVGKTRLSLRVANEVLEMFAQGVWLIELAPLANPHLVLQAIAAIFDVREDRSRSLEQALVDYLSTRQLLLVLDNCEHLVEACACLAEKLLHACPNLRILATSREALGVEGEALYPVPSLAAPNLQRLPPIEELLQYDAVRLFIERAAQVQPGYLLSPENGPAVAEVCSRLEGIPLALELAASRLNVLPVDKIAARLDDHLKLLTGGSRTALPRQRTLQASIDWSYELLSEAERALLRRSSVFAGGCTLEAVEAVCGVGGGDIPAHLSPALRSIDILDLLTQLLNKSLMNIVHTRGRPTRYHLLEMVRQYAQKKLIEAGEAEAMSSRHLAYYLRFTRELAPLALTMRSKEIMPLFREEFDNLRRALGWAFANGPGERVWDGLRLVIALENVWEMTGFLSEADSWSQKGLELLESATEADHILRTWALYIRGRFTVSLSFLEVRDLFQKSLDLFRLCSDQYGQAKVLPELIGLLRLIDPPAAQGMVDEAIAIASGLGNRESLGIAYYWKGFLLAGQENTQAQELLEKSLALLSETGNIVRLKLPLTTLGDIAMRLGDADKAQTYFQQALDLSRGMDDQNGIANSLGFLGMVAYLRQDFKVMQAYIQESLDRFREQSIRGSICWMLRHLAIATKRLGDLQQATQLYREGLALSQTIRDDYGVLSSLTGLAGIAAAQGELLKAARWLGAAAALFESFTKPLDKIEQLEFERDIAALRGQLNQGAFQAAWEEGRLMTLEQALSEARFN